MSEKVVPGKVSGWRRALHLALGAWLVLVTIPAWRRLAEFATRARRFGPPAREEWVAVAATALAMLLVAIAGLSRVGDALRGTRPAHPYRLILLAALIMVALAVHFAGGVAPVIAGELGGAAAVALSIVVLALAATIHVVVHELGHVAAARLMGWRLESLRLGPIALCRVGERLHLQRNRVRLRGVLGSAVSVPGREEGFARAAAVMFLGGPAATIALTLACAIAAGAVSPPSSDEEAVTSFLLWHATLVGAFLAAVNLIPFRLRNGIRNDGSRAWMAIRARTDGAREALRFGLNMTLGRRPREWGRSVQALLAAAESDARYVPEVRLAALNVALDTGEHAAADALLVLGCGFDHVEDAFRQEFLLQGALVAALVRGDVASARARLEEVGPTPLREYPLLAHAATALAEGRHSDARTSLATWKQAVDRAGIAGLRVGNEWALELLEARLA